MSDHVTTAPAAPFVEPDERDRNSDEGGLDWPLAAALSATVLILYAAVGTALYLVVTILA
jgi:hypothetical protein